MCGSNCEIQKSSEGSRTPLGRRHRRLARGLRALCTMRARARKVKVEERRGAGRGTRDQSPDHGTQGRWRRRRGPRGPPLGRRRVCVCLEINNSSRSQAIKSRKEEFRGTFFCFSNWKQLYCFSIFKRSTFLLYKKKAQKKHEKGERASEQPHSHIISIYNSMYVFGHVHNTVLYLDYIHIYIRLILFNGCSISYYMDGHNLCNIPC